MPGNQLAVHHDVRCEVIPAGVGGGFLLQHVFQQEWHNVGQANGLFLTVAEAGHVATADQVLPWFDLDVSEDRRGMAYGANDLVLFVGCLDQSDGLVIVDQVPQWAMASGVKQGVVVVHIHIRQFLRAGERFLGMGVLLEATGGFRQCILSFTVGVDGWLPALGRGNGDVCAGIPENVIGGGELFQPILHRKYFVNN